MGRRLMVTALVGGMLVAGNAHAARPQGGDFALFYTGFATNNAFGAGGAGGAGGISNLAVDRPTYNVGWFVTDSLMPYGGLAYQSRGSFSETLLRGGARFYGIPLGTSNVSTFVSGEANIYSSDNGDAFGLGGFLGTEYHVSRHFGISARVGLKRIDPDQGNTTLTIGASDLSVNYYF